MLTRNAFASHPAVVAAALVLLLNDHWLKWTSWAPPALTGKLSDVVGLFVCPVLLAKALQLCNRNRPATAGSSRASGIAIFCCGATGLVFGLVKTSAPFNSWITGVWGTMVLDATDLWALPVLLLSGAFIRRRYRPRAQAQDRTVSAERLAALVLAVACIATPAPYMPPDPAPCTTLTKATLFTGTTPHRVEIMFRGDRRCEVTMTRLSIDTQLDERTFISTEAASLPRERFSAEAGKSVAAGTLILPEPLSTMRPGGTRIVLDSTQHDMSSGLAWSGPISVDVTIDETSAMRIAQ